jgi:hypothetical protein
MRPAALGTAQLSLESAMHALAAAAELRTIALSMVLSACSDRSDNRSCVY